jgi:hypothetical protein
MCDVLFLFCGGEAPRVLRGEGKPLNARRMFGAMHKSGSPSSLQTPIGFVNGEPMNVVLFNMMSKLEIHGMRGFN